jgi:hypothetical protein
MALLDQVTVHIAHEGDGPTEARAAELAEVADEASERALLMLGRDRDSWSLGLARLHCRSIIREQPELRF